MHHLVKFRANKLFFNSIGEKEQATISIEIQLSILKIALAMTIQNKCAFHSGHTVYGLNLTFNENVGGRRPPDSSNIQNNICATFFYSECL